MPADGNRPLNVLIFGAALRQGSLNDRLASLAQKVVEKRGARVDRGSMQDVRLSVVRRRRGERRDDPRAGAGSSVDRAQGRDAFMIAVAGVQRVDARGAQEPDRLDVALPAAAVQRQAVLPALGVAVDGRRQPRALVAAHPARAPGRARVSGHVLARAGARGVRRRRPAGERRRCRSGSTRRSAASSTSSRRRSTTRVSRSSGSSSSARSRTPRRIGLKSVRWRQPKKALPYSVLSTTDVPGPARLPRRMHG